MHDIKQFSTFKTVEQITKGWSSDKKYYIETTKDKKLLLRIADIAEYSRKSNEFKMMQRLAELDLPMSQPIDFGTCNKGRSVYSLFTWCEGEDADQVLPKLTHTEQYQLGLKSGHILRQIHCIPAPHDQEAWSTRFNRKADNKINSYKDCGIQIDGGDAFITYIEANRHLLQNRPQTLQHGDYHVGNMVISDHGELSIIDFNRYDYGDPWEEFNRIVWSADISPHFATGQLNGYFNGKPPAYFFELLAFYISSNALGSIAWAIPFGEKQIDILKDQVDTVMTWFDGMQNPIPTWYLTDLCIQ